MLDLYWGLGPGLYYRPSGDELARLCAVALLVRQRVRNENCKLKTDDERGVVRTLTPAGGIGARSRVNLLLGETRKP